MTTTTMTTIAAEPPPSLPLVANRKPPPPTNNRYACGFCYCRRCSKWIKPQDVVYGRRLRPSTHCKNPNDKRARCPECSGVVRIRPPGAAAHDRYSKAVTGAEVKRY
jgi:hypothetical protein